LLELHALSATGSADIALYANDHVRLDEAALQLSREIDCQYKMAFVLSHKLCEVVAAEQKAMSVSGEVELDGAYFGGHIRPANQKEARIDRRPA
jgi:hypothetical protein